MSYRQDYPEILEQTYCVPPKVGGTPDVLFIGSGIGLYGAEYLRRYTRNKGLSRPDITVADAGKFDLPDHLGNMPGYDRRNFVASPERLGGKLSLWGVSIPVPHPSRLQEYPYPLADLLARFEAVSREMGGADAIPESGKQLEAEVRSRLTEVFDADSVDVAPLAIDKHGKRWSPLKYVPDLHNKEGVDFVTRFRVEKLERCGDRIVAVHGRWHDGSRYTIRPRHVVLGIGVQPTTELLTPVLKWSAPRPISDHHRIDMNAVLPAGHYGKWPIEEHGVAVLIVELVDEEDGKHTPYHLEVKLAPLMNWRLGHMQSSDNLIGCHDDDAIYVQIQCVGAMKDRLPPSDFVNTGGRRGMTTRDRRLRSRMGDMMEKACFALGIDSPAVFDRQIGENHHEYRCCTVGTDVDKYFRSMEIDNLTVLPPAAFFDHECDANPTLKSVVLTQYAMENLATTYLEAKPGVPVRRDAKDDESTQLFHI